MKTEHKLISPYDLDDNIFKLIDKDWMLITAGTEDHYNTMTASWGHLGIIWNMPIAIAYIRPQRYTYGFANDNDYYTLCFFGEEYRKALQYCGSRSGRDYDKVKETGLTPRLTENGNIYFEEARLVMECEKIYQDELKKENFLKPEVAEKNYAKGDFHRFYMGKIVSVMVKGR